MESIRTVVVWDEGDKHVRPVGPTASGAADLSGVLMKARAEHAGAAMVLWEHQCQTVSAVQHRLSTGRWPWEKAPTVDDDLEPLNSYDEDEDDAGI